MKTSREVTIVYLKKRNINAYRISVNFSEFIFVVKIGTYLLPNGKFLPVMSYILKTQNHIINNHALLPLKFWENFKGSNSY